MNRLSVAVLLAAVALGGCQGAPASARPAPASARPAPACTVRLPGAPPAGSGPLAVLRDIAAGPTEYLLGSPGGAVVRLDASTGFAPPQLVGHTLFFSVREAASSAIYRGALGGCAKRIGEGTMGSVEPAGRAFTAVAGNHWVLLDRDGRHLTPVAGPGSWTADGHLVESAPGAVDLYDLSGRKRTIPLVGVTPISIFGPQQVLVSGTMGIQSLDLATGALKPVAPASVSLRGATGSPDGRHVAYIDQNGAGKLYSVPTGQSVALPAPSLTTGFSWSHDSGWIAVQTIYGGGSIRLADGFVVEMGSLVVVSW